MIRKYKNCALRIRGSAENGYTIEAEVSDGSSVSPQPFTLPRAETELRLDRLLRQPVNAENLRVAGRELFDTLFPPGTPIHDLWVIALHGLRDEEGLRIRLHIDPPGLRSIAWELIYEDGYLGLDPRFSIVRYPDLRDPPRPVHARSPLRVLVAVSQPQDAPLLDVCTELNNVQEALAPLSGKVEMEIWHSARRDELLTRLRRSYHVLHYIGHGRFRDDQGYLVLENPQQRSDLVSATLLGQMLADRDLRLVVLNACETAISGSESAFSGVADQLVTAGVSAVIAQQMAIVDQNAAAFSREFYRALAEGSLVDTAVQEGRRSIMTAEGNDWDRCGGWAIPTLYMRGEGRVFPKEKSLAQQLEVLREWKEVHHLYQKLLIALKPFLNEVDLASTDVRPWHVQTGKRRWIPVSERIRELQEFAKSAKHIFCEPFYEDDNVLRGDQCVVKITRKAHDVEMFLDGHDVDGLYDRAFRFDEAVAKCLDYADYGLRGTVEEASAALRLSEA